MAIGLPHQKLRTTEESRMTLGEWENKLREKERELLTDMSRMETDTRATGISGTQNGWASAERKKNLLEETAAEWNLFTLVRDALQRIRLGTFGTCAECCRQIEEQRLNAIPWTAFCRDHQNLHDRELARYSA
jgi:RNA polymerase-binding transcription factor DksA